MGWAVLTAAFIVIERRSHSPLVPLSIFRRRTLTAANGIGLILGMAVFGMFYLLSLYMQIVLGFSALETGLGYLAVALTAVVASGVAQALTTRAGVKPVLATGMGLLAAGLVYFTQISADGSYVADLLPGFLLIGVGLGFAFVPISIAALSGASEKEAGLASGPHQHEPADRRRDRPRDPHQHLDHAGRQPHRRGRRAGRRVDRRLLARLLGGGRDSRSSA